MRNRSERFDLEAARRLYAPSVEGMRARLVDLGESLHNASADLARDLTVERVDRFMDRLQAASDFSRLLRRALVQGGGQ